jgi:HK97 family phage prohead protease
LLKAGKVAGLSFGYRVRRARGEAPRELEEVELVEVSLVTRPMQPKARVHAVEDRAPQ